MKRFTLLTLAVTAAALVIFAVRTSGQTPVADPYANNPDAGKQRFPLAAPAGKNSDAINTPLPGGVNLGKIDPGTWTYGPQAKAPANAKLWNPVKAKLMAGEKVTGGDVLQRQRSRDLLRVRERRVRLHLDRDAARPA